MDSILSAANGEHWQNGDLRDNGKYDGAVTVQTRKMHTVKYMRLE